METPAIFDFCGPSDDPDEQTAVTAAFRHVTIQLKRLAGPILPAEPAARLAAINVEVKDLYSAYDANADVTALLLDIEEASEAAKSSNLVTTAGMSPNLPFSQRNNYAPTAPAEITIREDAPESVRMVMLDMPLELGFRPKWLRTIVCRVRSSRQRRCSHGRGAWSSRVKFGGLYRIELHGHGVVLPETGYGARVAQLDA